MADFSDVTAVLITKEEVYPPEVLASVAQWPFVEIMVRTKCAGIYERYELSKRAYSVYVYVQDDDAICPVGEVVRRASDRIVCAMKPHYMETYAELRCALVGWGAVFPRDFVSVLGTYKQHWGEDEVYRKETDRIFTALHYPQVRISHVIMDMPWSTNKDRLSMEADHYQTREEALRRCESLT